MKGEKLVKRSAKIAFMNVGTTELPDWQRMRKFTDISTAKNPKEYSRQYVDEDSETTDTIGYAEEKNYAFDQYTDNPVHDKIVNITDNELTDDDATVEIMVVDTSKPNETQGFEARKRKYAVVPGDDGSGTDAYQYSGTFKAKGKFEKVNATISEDGKTATIVV